MSFDLRSLDLGDVIALAEVFEEVQPGTFDRPVLESQLLVPGTSAFGLFEADRLSAGLLVRRVLDEAEILMLGARRRRAGHGEALLRHGCLALAGAGVQRVFLEVAEDNDAARALYAKLGFRPVGRRRAYYSSGADALLLELTLS